METRVDLDDMLLGKLLLPIKVVWLRTRHDANPAELTGKSNQELIELCIDYDRLKKFGYQDAAQTLHRAAEVHGYPKVRDFISNRLSIE